MFPISSDSRICARFVLPQRLPVLSRTFFVKPAIFSFDIQNSIREPQVLRYNIYLNQPYIYVLVIGLFVREMELDRFVGSMEGALKGGSRVTKILTTGLTMIIKNRFQ